MSELSPFQLQMARELGRGVIYADEQTSLQKADAESTEFDLRWELADLDRRTALRRQMTDAMVRSAVEFAEVMKMHGVEPTVALYENEPALVKAPDHRTRKEKITDRIFMGRNRPRYELADTSADPKYWLVSAQRSINDSTVEGRNKLGSHEETAHYQGLAVDSDGHVHKYTGKGPTKLFVTAQAEDSTTTPFAPVWKNIPITQYTPNVSVPEQSAHRTEDKRGITYVGTRPVGDHGHLTLAGKPRAEDFLPLDGVDPNLPPGAAEQPAMREFRNNLAKVAAELILRNSR